MTVNCKEIRSTHKEKIKTWKYFTYRLLIWKTISEECALMGQQAYNYIYIFIYIHTYLIFSMFRAVYWL